MSSEKGPEMTPEMLRNTSDIAAQAAHRAQQMLRKASVGDAKIPPDVPARGGHDAAKPPPEIPPKRQSLKRMSIGDEPQKPMMMVNKPPPPLPQKPMNSQQNSPHMPPKFGESPRNSPQLGMRPVPPTPQMQPKFEKFMPASPQVAIKFTDKITSSPQFSMKQSPLLSQRGMLSSIPNSPQLAAKSKPLQPAIATKQLQSPSDDHSSEDALRGIESGLRNMERAMQEQLNLRSMEAAAAAAVANQQHNNKIDSIHFNPMEFKANMRGMGGGSITSLDGTGQNHKAAIEQMRMQQNMRSMERGFSMDQMRLDNLHHSVNIGGGGQVVTGNSGGGMQQHMRPMESNPNIRSAIEEMKMKGIVDHSGGRPIENHMRSLDRNLPLELQYSRHRAQDVTDFRDQMRQMGRQSAGVSREDLRMRRRSSHDENQISQGVPGKHILIVYNFSLFLFRTVLCSVILI